MKTLLHSNFATRVLPPRLLTSFVVVVHLHGDLLYAGQQVRSVEEYVLEKLEFGEFHVQLEVVHDTPLQASTRQQVLVAVHCANLK